MSDVWQQFDDWEESERFAPQEQIWSDMKASIEQPWPGQDSLNDARSSDGGDELWGTGDGVELPTRSLQSPISSSSTSRAKVMTRGQRVAANGLEKVRFCILNSAVLMLCADVLALETKVQCTIFDKLRSTKNAKSRQRQEEKQSYSRRDIYQ
jgi:hypothetical protein